MMKQKRYICGSVLGTAAWILLYGAACGAPVVSEVVTMTGFWRFSAGNVDGAGWALPGYDGAGWSVPGPALFFIETATLPAPKNTPLPPRSGGGPLPCYYFRTEFEVSDLADIIALDVTYLVDDGAVFYLNGTEIQRVRMAAGSVSYATGASGNPPGGDAVKFESFRITGVALTNLVQGANLLAVRVHQYGTSSSDVVFGARVEVIQDADPAIHLLRGPYLQQATSTGIVIRWRTSLAESSRVVVGHGSAELLRAGSALAVTEHEVTVTGLEPDQLYTYTIGSEARVLAGDDGTCTFRTHPRAGQPTPLRVWVTGDAGTTYTYQRDVRDAFEAMNGDRTVHAWLQLGDNAYNEGTDAQYQAAMFDMYAPRLRKTTVWPVFGNHDSYSRDWNGLYPYINIFSPPTAGESGGVASGTEFYYAFDIGSVHFVVLDSTLPGRSATGTMAQWLRADLAANTNRWVIVSFHHPPYTKGSHDSDTESALIEMRENIVPILEAGGVDLVLNGHSHSYERSFLLNGHTGHSSTLDATMILDGGSGAAAVGDSAYVKSGDAEGDNIGHQGIVYAVVGCSGKLSGGDLNHPAMLRSLNKAGSLVLDITHDRLDAVFLRDTGATNDWFSIIKPGEAMIAGNRLFTVGADQPAALLLTAGSPPLSFGVNRLPGNGVLSDLNQSAGSVVYTPAHGSTNSDSFAYYVTDGQSVSFPGTVQLQIEPSADADRDGMPDLWETRRGVTDPDEDFDMDGVSNLDEYRSNTDPKDKNSWLHMSGVSTPSGGFQCEWASVGGVRYRIMYSDGDRSGGFNGVFAPLPQPVAREMDPRPAGEPGTMRFVDDYSLTGGPPASGCRYYRVQVVN